MREAAYSAFPFTTTNPTNSRPSPSPVSNSTSTTSSGRFAEKNPPARNCSPKLSRNCSRSIVSVSPTPQAPIGRENRRLIHIVVGSANARALVLVELICVTSRTTCTSSTTDRFSSDGNSRAAA